MHHRIAQRGAQPVSVTAKQHHRTAVRSNRSLQRRKVSALAIATGNQHQLAVHVRSKAVDRRQRSAHVGCLGIVEVRHVVVAADPLAAVRQAGEAAQRIEHSSHRQTSRLPERQRRQRIGLIVRAAHFQLAGRHQRLEFISQPAFAVLLDQAKTLEVRTRQTKGQSRQIVCHQRTRQRVIAVHHNLLRAAEDAVLGQVIGRQRAVAIHVVFTDIQHGGDHGIEVSRGLQLKA